MEKLGTAHENLDHKVYRILKSMISERKFKPGTKIYQDQLAQELGISRTPLVGALKKLEQEMLIMAIPRRGFYVRQFSQEEMIHIFELREVLEGLAARRASMVITPEQAGRLTQFFRGVKISDDPKDVRKYAEEDRKFHYFLMEMGGNDLLSSILGTYSIITFSFLAGYQEGLVRHPRETIREHRALIDAICKRDPIQAEHFARLHLIHSRERLAKEVKLPAHRAGLPGNVDLITGSAFLPAYKAGHPADLPVKEETESPAQGKKPVPRKPLQPKN